jgi:hypothetical protein
VGGSATSLKDSSLRTINQGVKVLHEREGAKESVVRLYFDIAFSFFFFQFTLFSFKSESHTYNTCLSLSLSLSAAASSVSAQHIIPVAANACTKTKHKDVIVAALTCILTCLEKLKSRAKTLNNSDNQDSDLIGARFNNQNNNSGQDVVGLTFGEDAADEMVSAVNNHLVLSSFSIGLNSKAAAAKTLSRSCLTLLRTCLGQKILSNIVESNKKVYLYICE